MKSRDSRSVTLCSRLTLSCTDVVRGRRSKARKGLSQTSLLSDLAFPLGRSELRIACASVLASTEVREFRGIIPV